MATVLRRGYTGGSSGSSSGTSAAARKSLEQTQEKGVLTTSSGRESRTTEPKANDFELPERTSPRRYLEDWDYTPSKEVTAARSALQAQEANRPAAFQSQYEGAVQSILDGILNRKQFDVTTDANYQQLYELAKQRYQANASRSMRDTMAAANTATGGYGNTYSQAVGQQAYDRTMEGLNDQNLALMEMAYRMYQDETADRYNRLNAVNTQDAVDYGRYRDTVGDYQTDRNYYRQRLLDEYGIDYGQYMDSLGQSNSAEEFQRAQDAAELAQGNWYDEMRYRASQDALSQQNYEREWENSQYQQALAGAMQMAGNGLGVPQRYAAQLDADTLAQLQALAAQRAAARQRGGGSGGGSGRSTSSGAEERTITQDEFNADYSEVLRNAIESGETPEDARALADAYRAFIQEQGYTIVEPEYRNLTDLRRAERTAIQNARSKR